MSALSADEIWRLVPPDEKLSIVSRTHASGSLAAFIFLTVASSTAIGLQIKWIFWSSLAIAPLIFQMAAGKKWRDIKPRIMLEYLAVRSVSRRYAYAVKSRELGVRLVFRGELERLVDDSDAMAAAMAALEEAGEPKPVWITLLTDAVIAVSERPGGAKLEAGFLIDDKLKIEGFDPGSDRADRNYTAGRQVVVTMTNARGIIVKYRFTSAFPVAINAFEKLMYDLQVEAIERRKFEQAMLTEAPKEEPAAEEAGEF